MIPDEDVARTSTAIDLDAPEVSEKPVKVGEHVVPQVTVPDDWQMFVPAGAVLTSSSVTVSVAVAVAAFDIVAEVPLATAVTIVPLRMFVPETG
jgi:hypothetical protein